MFQNGSQVIFHQEFGPVSEWLFQFFPPILYQFACPVHFQCIFSAFLVGSSAVSVQLLTYLDAVVWPDISSHFLYYYLFAATSKITVDCAVSLGDAASRTTTSAALFTRKSILKRSKEKEAPACGLAVSPSLVNDPFIGGLFFSLLSCSSPNPFQLEPPEKSLLDARNIYRKISYLSSIIFVISSFSASLTPQENHQMIFRMSVETWLNILFWNAASNNHN